MMIKKIVFLFPVPLSQKIYDDFYTGKLLKKNIEVEYWDFSSLFNQGDLHRHELIYNETTKVTTKEMFQKLLVKNKSHLSNILFVSGFTYCYRFLFIYRILNQHKLTLALFARGALPIGLSAPSKKARITYLLTRLFSPSKWNKNLQTALALFLKRFNFTKKVDIIFQAGSKGINTIGAGYSMDVSAAKQIIPINHFDYDKLQILTPDDAIETESYIVFLDEYLPHHPDFDLLSMDKINANRYYEDLNRFFKYLEQSTGSKIVIAAHPKAVYDVNPFDGRTIYFGKTIELLKNTKLALAHASTSIGSAVCFNKKIILMTSKEIKSINRGIMHQAIVGFSSTLDLPIHDLSTLNHKTFVNTLVINKQKYNHYKYSYITSKASEKKTTWDIFYEYISNNNYTTHKA